jgi:hypothetical protein
MPDLGIGEAVAAFTGGDVLAGLFGGGAAAAAPRSRSPRFLRSGSPAEPAACTGAARSQRSVLLQSFTARDHVVAVSRRGLRIGGQRFLVRCLLLALQDVVAEAADTKGHAQWVFDKRVDTRACEVRRAEFAQQLGNRARAPATRCTRAGGGGRDNADGR